MLESGGFFFSVISIAVFVILVISTFIYLASRYRRCPSDMILVVYGKVGVGQSARCIHGGGAFILPLIQDYSYMSLTPMTISIPLQNALSMQNIRIHVPSTFTVGISTEPSIMNSAAERLLNLKQSVIEEMAKEIIFGQLRLTVASLTIEQINQDRESFLEHIRKNVAPELSKIGLYLINVNITDITDESGYIESIGKKAASEAINQAKIDVAVQDKLGAIGEAEAVRIKEIRVAEHVAEADKGKKQAEADRRVFIQQQESTATIGEAVANREQEIKVAENIAESDKGKKKAEADRRIYIHGQEAEAVTGENTARADIANTNADLAVKEARALQQGEVARLDAQVEIQKAQYRAEQERLNAAEVVRQEVDKLKITIAAEAEAERIRREAKGTADATLFQYEAEARGQQQVLEGKAAGYLELLKSCGGDVRGLATLLMTEKIEEIVSMQIEAIKNIKIDKVTVWDSGKGDTSSTANFLSGLLKSLPPLHDVAEMAGVELPKYLGEIVEKAPGKKKAAPPPPAGKEE